MYDIKVIFLYNLYHLRGEYKVAIYGSLDIYLKDGLIYWGSYLNSDTKNWGYHYYQSHMEIHFGLLFADLELWVGVFYCKIISGQVCKRSWDYLIILFDLI